ncbi:hypothetical protein [Candidatus Nitrotoga sp. M5]|uniref:hypothetical protein n=1 Tax=Candidatus Nitrotoga sp. M5 TaxID=2890409 RepID=UPI001EF1C754|nr:hypothetical protein [Candidatus Nitrotoga sp. M5]
MSPTDLCHRSSQCRQVELPVRPIVRLPDVFVIAAIHAVIMKLTPPIRKLFTARYAVKVSVIRRKEGAGA